MAKVKKNQIDFDTTLIELKFRISGDRNILSVWTTVSESMQFVDVLNQNRHRKLSRSEQEMMENRFYIFTDYKKKSDVMISFKDIKYAEIPFFLETDDNLDLKIMTINN